MPGFLGTGISGANAAFTISVTTVFPAPVLLEGFAADDVFETEPIDSAEEVMGVDGFLSAGFVFVPVRQQIILQADSPSIGLFDAWWAAMQTLREVFYANGIVLLPDVNKKWALTNGILRSYKPIPDVKRLLQPQRFAIVWEQVSPAITF